MLAANIATLTIRMPAENQVPAQMPLAKCEMMPMVPTMNTPSCHSAMRG